MAKPFADYQRVKVEDYDKHRLFGISAGEPGSWKTSFWLDGPSPIGILSFDKGLEGVVDRILRAEPDKEIYVKEYDWCPGGEDDVEKAQEMLEEYKTDFAYFVRNCRTTLVDKENDLWLLMRFAFGLTGDNDQKDYDSANVAYRRLINMAKGSNCNVGFIRGMKDTWGEVTKWNGKKGRGPTGEREGSGHKELVGLTHFNLAHQGVGPEDVTITVGKVRGPGGYAIAGQTFAIGDWEHPFREFAQLVFPDSEPEEWI